MSVLDELKETDLIQSVYDETKNRMRSIMWGTFVISWCIWNWEPIYTTIFVDQKIILEQTKLIKIEYILNHYYSWKHIGSALWNLIKLLIGPSISTYLIVYQISKIDLIFFKQNYKNKIGQKNAALDLDEELLKKEKKIINDEKIILEQKKENINIQNKIKKDMTDEEKWDLEFGDLEKIELFGNSMIELKLCIYENNGWVSSEGFNVDTNYLTFLHLNGLIEFTNDYNTKISLTPKGTYILNKFSNKNPSLFLKK